MSAPAATSPRRLARALGLALVALFLALLVYGVTTRSPDTTIDDALARGDAPAAPALELDVLERAGAADGRVRAALADGRLGLGELRGVPVVLNFWASWCDPCRIEAPVLREGSRSARAAGVAVVGVDMQDLRGDAREFVREHGLAFPHVRDPERRAGQDWGVTGLPETFFLDARGRVVGHVVGALSSERMRAGIEAARSGRTIGALEGGARRATE